MKYTKIFTRTLFSELVIRKALELIGTKSGNDAINYGLIIYRQDHTWHLDNLDDFFGEYNQGFSRMHLYLAYGAYEIKMTYTAHDFNYEVSIKSPVKADINEVINYLIDNKEKCSIDTLYNSSRKPYIFIGHGRKNDWKELRDHLRDKHNYSFRYYESGDRSSEYLFENVHEMITGSKLSILVLSNEDKMEDQTMRARQNVIHELGMAQVLHGRRNTLILVEEGCDWPSNIQGINCFPYSGSIKEVYGDIVSALEKRMFEIFTRER